MKTLDRALWKALKAYLLIDRKHSDKSSAVSANKSRFFKLADYFSDKDFNRENFNLFIGELKEKGYSYSSINNIIKIAKNLCNYRGIDELKDYSYFPEGRSNNHEVLTTDEIIKIRDVEVRYVRESDFINHRQSALIFLLATTGCRIDEALRLKWENLHSSPLPFVEFKDTKSNENRVVPISQDLFNQLSAMSHRSTFIFSSWRGGRLEGQQTNLDFKKRAEKAKVSKRIYNKLFRESYITTMIDETGNWFMLAPIVGHKNPATTMRYYQNSLKKMQEMIFQHPLLRDKISYEQAIEQIKQELKKVKDSKSFTLEIKETNETLLVKIKKKN